MNESAFWQRIRKGLQNPPHTHLVRIENAIYSGTPDVSFCIDGHATATEGFMELKYLLEWPKRERTVIRVPHFTPAQRTWLHDRHMAGGKGFVCMGISKSTFLFEGLDAAMYLGKDWNRADMQGEALAFWDGRIDWDEFKEELAK